MAQPVDGAALVELVERLTRENRDLAGQVGYFQARAQVLDERVRALEAPKPEPEPAPVAPVSRRRDTHRLVLAVRALAALALVLLAAAAWVR